MTRLSCPQCESPDVIFYDGMLGYEAIRCNTCNMETDANRLNCCERPDRSPGTRGPLPDLCHHAEYRIYINGQYVESVGNLGGNAQRALQSWQRRRRGDAVEWKIIPCRVLGCERGRP
jgi:hypothetical protein